jgi:hypothetical protein
VTDFRTAPISLQILLIRPARVDCAHLESSILQLGGPFTSACVDFDSAAAAQGTPYGTIVWPGHEVRVVGLPGAVPTSLLDACVRSGYYADDIKRQAYEHRGHLLLYHTGKGVMPLAAYQALALVAGILGTEAGIVVTNEAARTSMPAHMLSPAAAADAGVSYLELVQQLPPLLLYCGMAKLEIDGEPGVWLRTHGCDRLALPDLAYHVEAHAETSSAFELLSQMVEYLLTSGARLAPGDRVHAGGCVISVRLPLPQESWFETETPLLVLMRS